MNEKETESKSSAINEKEAEHMSSGMNKREGTPKSSAMDEKEAEHKIVKVTLRGTLVNLLLIMLKFAAGILGSSAAMLADAVHSVSDLLTDIIVLIFVKMGLRPKDKNHDYGHGKFETLCTVLIGLALFFIGLMICYNGAKMSLNAFQGEVLERPGYIALVAAIVSMVLKEWCYRFTIRTSRETHSPALAANAWHHRSDALSSLGTTIGIGGAILLGEKWRVLDPITAMIVSFFILRVAYFLVKTAIGELLEESLPDDLEDEIIKMASMEENVTDVHHLMTRRIGRNIAIEMHIRVPGDLSVTLAHLHATNIENKLKEKYGQSTHVGIHIEPIEEKETDVEN